MKFKTILFSACLLIGLQLSAQKFAYIDSDYVLSHMQEYSDAQQELNKLSVDWQTEIEEKYESIARLEASYRAEKVLLTDEMKRRREEDITRKKQEATELQKSKFGIDGELFQRREQLIQPVQDKMFEAIKEVSSTSGYMVIFDIKKNSNMLYSNPKYNVSDKVIKKMGYKPGETIEDTNKEGGESMKSGGKSGGKSGNKQSTQTTSNSKGQQVRSGGKSSRGKK